METLLLIWNILLFLIVLTVIISIHELGHFLLAKRAGILIHEFSIGMGPAIISRKKGETSYSLRAIPLGGYVAMSGENGDNALINVGSIIGVNLNEIGLIKEIILDQSICKPLIVGEVLSFDLFGKDLKELFIEIKTEDQEIHKYQVTRDAKYLYAKKKEIQITPEESSFSSKSILDRFLVLFFGPLMNFILAIILLFMVAIIQGKPLTNNVVNDSTNPSLLKGDIITEINNIPVSNIDEIRTALESVNGHFVETTVIRNGETKVIDVYLTLVLQNIGIVNSTQPLYQDDLYIAGLGGKAKAAGLNVGDKILSVDDGSGAVLVNTWSELLEIARNYESDQITLVVLRKGEEKTITYEVLSEDVLSAIGTEKVSIRMGFTLGYAFDLLYTFTYPFTQFGGSVTEMVATLGLLFNPNSGVGVSDLAGPVGIFSLVSNAAAGGFISLIGFVAFLSVNIGLMNLLPIPALDGGRLIFLGYEAITKKKIPAKFELWVNNAFFFLLLGLFVFVTWNDILRLFA